MGSNLAVWPPKEPIAVPGQSWIDQVLKWSDAELADLVNYKHQECEAAASHALMTAREAGLVLMVIKGRCKRGEWLPWLEQNCRFRPWTAQLYMRIAKRFDELPTTEKNVTASRISLEKRDSVTHLIAGDEPAQLTLREAAKLLSRPRPRQVEVIEGEFAEQSEIGDGVTAKQALSNPDAHDVHLTPLPIKVLVYGFFEQGLDLDPCSNSHEFPNIEARRVYTLEDDGLNQHWAGSVFLNPPYSGKHGTKLEDWAYKLAFSYQHGEVSEAVVLVPNYSSEGWWYTHFDQFPMVTIQGRLVFGDADGKPQPSGARFASVLFYLGDRVDRFRDFFGGLGRMWRPEL